MDTKRLLKAGAYTLGVGVVLFVGFMWWQNRQLQNAANATANETDASMDASTSPGNIQLGSMPPGNISIGNSPMDNSLNTYASFTPQNVQSWVASESNASMTPVTGWEYDPNYHLPYSVPTLPTGFQAPTVSTEQGAYVGTGTYMSGGLMLEAN